MGLVSTWESSLYSMGLVQVLCLLIRRTGSPIVGTVVLEDRVEIEPNTFLKGGRDMTEDERRILGFCIGKWTHLAVLEEQIPRSTLYRVARKLCGRKWLLHRRARGYMTTKRGTQLLEESPSGVERLKEDKRLGKGDLVEKEGKRKPKTRPVNLIAIKKLLELPDKTINCLSSLYPPLKKAPTPTHEAVIELIWAEACSRRWPITHDHRLNFLNFGDIFTWKTSLAKFCAYMEGVKDVDSCIIESCTERGRSLWVRRGASGAITFKRDILEMPLVCLDDYGDADTEAKKAAAHLLRGRTKIPVENEMQMIPCVTIVNLNPKQGDTIFKKTGFDKSVIRRVMPCDMDVIEIPGLIKVGQKALDAAKILGPLKMEEPASSCVKYREKLHNYSEKLFTEEGRNYIDIEGLLNIARGFTGHGFTASEAIRYTLYKASLLYHTLGWLRAEWCEGFREEKPTLRSSKTSAPEEIEGEEKARKVPSATQEHIQVAQKTKEFEEKRKIIMEFRPKYKRLMDWIRWVINHFQDLQKDEIWNFLLPAEKEKCITTLNAFNLLREHFGKTKEGDWAGLKYFESRTLDFEKQYVLPALPGFSEGETKYFIERMKILKNLPKEDNWNTNVWSRLRQVDNSIMNLPLFSEEQKIRMREVLPEGYKKRILMHKEPALAETSHKAELETTQESDVLERVLERTSEKIKKWWKTRQQISLQQYQVEDLLSTRCYIQTESGLVSVKLIAKEDKWYVFQLEDGQERKLLYDRTQVVACLKPEYGAHTYPFVRQEGSNFIVRLNGKDQRIPIDQVDKMIYREQNKLQLISEPEATLEGRTYYKGAPVEIIDQGEHSYTIRDATGKDLRVSKSEIILKK